MARIRRYDLYEGDGEVIGEENWAHPNMLPGKQPLGREEELQERDREADRAEQIRAGRRRRYFPENEKEADPEIPDSLFDDFDRFEAPIPELPRRKRKKRIRHKGAWIFCMAMSCIGILICGWLLIPQVTGSRFRLLPNLAFANGNILQYNEKASEDFA